MNKITGNCDENQILKARQTNHKDNRRVVRRRLGDGAHSAHERIEPMIEVSQIREHMQVRSSDGQPIGKVDKLEGNRIKLTKDGSNALGEHQYIGLDSVISVEDDALCLDKTAEEARREIQQRHSENGGSQLIDL